MMQYVRIRKHEVGLWFRHGDFKQVLDPGAYRLFGRMIGRDEVEIFDTHQTQFDHDLIETLLEDENFQSRVTVVDLDDDQRALIWKDGRLGWILGAGRHVFWNKPYNLKVETFDANEFHFTHPKVETILNHPGGSRFFDGVRVENHERVLLFRDCRLVDQLGPGVHMFWKHGAKVTWKSVDLREQVADVAGQEIMTADKVTLRVNLVVTHQVTDVEKAVTVVHDYQQALYREAQLVLREAVGGRPLDRLLADKDEVGNEVRNALAERASQFGVTVRSIGLRDLILPGDMKAILNEVILAQKQAEANLIRRREETAAARSQANTAKLLADNPALARMKELEALQDVLKGTKATFLFGRGDLIDQVRSLTANGPNCPLEDES